MVTTVFHCIVHEVRFQPSRVLQWTRVQRLRVCGCEEGSTPTYRRRLIPTSTLHGVCGHVHRAAACVLTAVMAHRTHWPIQAHTVVVGRVRRPPFLCRLRSTVVGRTARHVQVRVGQHRPPLLRRLRSALVGSADWRMTRAHGLSKRWHRPCGTIPCQRGVVSLLLRRFAGFVHDFTRN